jgi:FAD/FMN-containing dehydrogenase
VIQRQWIVPILLRSRNRAHVLVISWPNCGCLGPTGRNHIVPNPFVARENILSWSRTLREPQLVAAPRFRDQLPALMDEAAGASKLAIGLRRSYSDSCLNGAGALIDMRGLDRFISFEPNTGVLRAEAGVTFSDILRLVVPNGWFPFTAPGTRFITLGGALANDVHGKNHHSSGSFGRHVRSFGLLRSDSGRQTVTPEGDPALFSSTVGGLGLTGVVEWVEIQLVKIGSSYLDVETVPYARLNEFWPLMVGSETTFEHTVAWIDCTSRGEKRGRGILGRANWLDDGVYDVHDDRSWKCVPFEAPSFLLNSLTLSAFNNAYYRFHSAKAARSRQHYASFFYPLDGVRGWNKLYGRCGMFQYQCIIPRRNQRDGIAALLDVITASEQASFLAVLKTFGALTSPGLLSFPREGATLALDFPFRGETTLKLMARLDAIVAEAGGALYPAKDGRMRADMFRLSYPRWTQLAKDPSMSSNFWRRVAQ